MKRLAGTSDPVHVKTAWHDEIARRVQEIEAGVVELEDGPSAMRRLRERARQRLERCCS